MSYRILVTEAMSEDGPDWLRANGYEVKYGRGTDEKTLIEDLQDCDGVIPRLAVMSDAVISACPRLKVIARHGSGVDTVDLESCRRHGVRVVNTRGSNSVAVAEHAMLLVLACAKTLNVLQDRYRAGQFKEARKLAAGVEISGKTLGVFGFGQIGRRVAAMAHDGFGMKILAFDPFCKPESVPDYVALVSDRDKIFDNADFITLHMAATAENKHGIGAREFARMKKTACLINTTLQRMTDSIIFILL